MISATKVPSADPPMPEAPAASACPVSTIAASTATRIAVGMRRKKTVMQKSPPDRNGPPPTTREAVLRCDTAPRRACAAVLAGPTRTRIGAAFGAPSERLRIGREITGVLVFKLLAL